MSISSATLTRQTRERVSQRDVTIRPGWALLAAISATILAYLPVLLIYLPQLWARQYYRFFPFAFAATIGLAVFRAEGWTGLSGSRARLIVRVSVFVFAETLLAMGLWSESPWPCFVAFILTIGVVMDCWTDQGGKRSLAYLVLPLVLVIRPPLHLDETVIQSLQTVTSQNASAFLNGIGIDHLLSGNVIEPFMGSPLLVEEACSGVQSLFTLMFIAAFLSVYRRYTLARSLALTASAVIWALMMNIFRVITIVISQTEFQRDLTTGWQHEMVGYVGMILAIVMLLSTDRLLLALLGGIPDLALRYRSINVFVSAWNWLMLTPETGEAASGGSTAEKATAAGALADEGRPLNTRGALIGIGSLIAIAIVTATPAWGLPGLTTDSSRTNLITQLQAVDESWLVESQFPGCSVLSFEARQRNLESQFGQHSDEWMFNAPFGKVLNSMDHVFDSWHDLTVCYRSIGWRLNQITEVSDAKVDASTVEWPVVYAEFVKPTGERAHLCFSLFTVAGTPVLPEGETSGIAGISRRLKQSRIDGQQVVQVQSLNESIVSLKPAAVQQLIEIHVNAREQLRGRVVTATGSSVAAAPETEEGAE